jgi:hypothetical protein
MSGKSEIVLPTSATREPQAAIAEQMRAELVDFRELKSAG